MEQDPQNEFYDEPIIPGEITHTPEEQGQLAALAAEAERTDMVEEVPEEIPEELSVTDVLQLIPIAIANNRMLQIMYTKNNGEIKSYVVEPYEVGGNKSHPAGYLWGFDRNVGTIKSFFLSGLIDIQILEETFIPRG